MAGLFSRIKDGFSNIVNSTPGAGDRYDDEYDDYDYDYEDEYDDYDDYRGQDSGGRGSRGGSRDYDRRQPYDSGRPPRSGGGRRDRDDRYDRDDRHDRDDRGGRGGGGSYRRSQSTSLSARYGDILPYDEPNDSPPAPQSESIIMRPKLVDDAVEICNHVRAGRTCVIDLTALNNSNAQRIADFLSGVCQALDGVTERVNDGIFIVAPKNHKVRQDYREELPLDGSGFFTKAAGDR